MLPQQQQKPQNDFRNFKVILNKIIKKFNLLILVS
jgi:hypothetical protein